MPDLTDNNATDLGEILSHRMQAWDFSAGCVFFDLDRDRELLNLTCVTQQYAPERVTALETDLSGLTFRFSGQYNFLMPIMSSTPTIKFDNSTWICQDHSWHYIRNSFLPQSSWMDVEFDSAFFFSESVLDGSRWKIISNSSIDSVEWEGCSFAESVFYGMQTRMDSQATESGIMFRMDSVSGSITFTGNYINSPVVITGIAGASLYIREAELDFLYITNAEIGRVAIDNSVISEFHFSYSNKESAEFLVNQSVLSCNPFEYGHLWMTDGAQWSFNGVQLNQCRNVVIDSVRHVNWINSTLVDSQIELRGNIHRADFEACNIINTGSLPANLSMPMLTGIKSNRLNLVNSRFSCHSSPEAYDNCIEPMVTNIDSAHLTVNGLVLDNMVIENWSVHPTQKKSSVQINEVIITGNEVRLNKVKWACDEREEPCLPLGLVVDNNTHLNILCPNSSNNRAHRFFKPASALMSAMASGMSTYPSCIASQEGAPPLFEQEYDKQVFMLLLAIAMGVLGTLSYLIYRSITQESARESKREDNALLP